MTNTTATRIKEPVMAANVFDAIADAYIAEYITPAPTTSRANPTTTKQVHMSHASCSHPRTPKARAACRKLRRSGASVDMPTTITLAGSKVVHLALVSEDSTNSAPMCTRTPAKNPAYDLDTPGKVVTCKNCIKIAK